MNQFLYYSLIIYLYLLSAISLSLIIYTIIKLKKRKDNCIYISKFFVFFGYFCIAMFWIIFIDAIHIDDINYQSTNIEFIVITMLILSTLGVIQLWMWTHYEIHIQEDKFVYCNLFSGKHIIEFNEIDIKNSKYLFVYHKGKRDFGYEILKLKLKDGKEYNFKLDMLIQDGDSLLMTDTIIFKLKIRREHVYR